MSITNGSIVAEADLDAMITAPLALIQADNAQLPGGLEVAFVFHNPTGALFGTNPERFKSVFVVPFDCYLESMAVGAGDLTNPSTVTVDLTSSNSDDILSLWPVSVSGAVAGTGDLPRLLFDGTKTAPRAFSTTAQAHRTLLRGGELKVTVDPGANAAAASVIRVVLVLREFFSRE